LTIGLVKSIIKKSGSVGYFHLLFHLYDFWFPAPVFVYIICTLFFQIRHLEVSRHAFDGVSISGTFLLKDVVMRTVVSLAFRFKKKFVFWLLEIWESASIIMTIRSQRNFFSFDWCFEESLLLFDIQVEKPRQRKNHFKKMS
jgi:hypothetical protein